MSYIQLKVIENFFKNERNMLIKYWYDKRYGVHFENAKHTTKKTGIKEKSIS